MKEVSLLKLIYIISARPQFIRYFPIEQPIDRQKD